MTAQVVLPIFLILTPLLNGFEDTLFSAFSYLSSTNEQIITGRFDEDIILPCSFKSGPKVIIHWQNQGTNNVHSYYRGSDHLERQDSRYTNRTSLFQSEIHNGNASLSLRRLSLVDEGIYVCYVGTEFGKSKNTVVLKVGAFLMPVMKYEKSSTNSSLICSIHIHPPSNIMWKMNNTTPVSESNMEEIRSLGPSYIKSTLDIAGSHSSYECAIENSLLKQTWMGRWARKDDLRRMQSEHVSLSCQLVNNSFPPNQDFRVTWSRVESGTSSVLAYYLSSSQNIIINEPRFSWNKELITQSDFSMNLTDLSLSDSGEYLCNISSSKYTLLTVYALHVEQSQGTASWYILLLMLAAFLVLAIFLILSVKCCLDCMLRHTYFGIERSHVFNDETASDADNAKESMPLSEYPAST